MGIFRFIINRLLDLSDDIDDDIDDDDIDDDIDDDDIDDDDIDDIDVDDIDDTDNEFGMSKWLEELMETTKGKRISFTGLVDRGLENSDAYQSWADGVNPFELSTDNIEEIASHIADEFSQALPEVKKDWFSGGFATNMSGDGIIFYDPVSIMKDSIGGYGASNIVGSIAHEMGHNIVERVFSDSNIGLTRLQHEIGADYMEGVVFGMTGLNPTEKFVWLRSIGGDSPNYLSADGRIDVIRQGIEWGKRLRLIGTNEPDKMIDVGNNEVLIKMLKGVMRKYTTV